MKLNPPRKLSELADITGATIIGDPDALVTGINEIHRVESGDLTFVDHPKYYDKALNSAATFVIINKGVAPPAGKALLFSDDPFRDYVLLTRKFMPFLPSSGPIHPDAVIGEGTVVQPNVSIGPGVRIGRDCIIHSGVVIYDHTCIGDRVVIQANTVLGADAFYFKRRPNHYENMQ
ncbi:MAG: LpxD N-terminal domain-containing protein [Bacteroidota bacterium]